MFSECGVIFSFSANYPKLFSKLYFIVDKLKMSS